MTTETTTVNPVEIDTQLADLYGQLATANQYVTWAIEEIREASGDRRNPLGRGPRWNMTVEEAIEAVETLARTENTERPWIQRSAVKALDKLAEARDKVQGILEAMAPLEAVYEAHRWSRFFLVNNHGGHIHSSMYCSTCRPTTQFGWLPTLSGLTEADAVKEHGTILCSVCFPSAPVEWTLGKAPNPDNCSGSGQPAVEGTVRGHYTSRYGQCPGCHEFRVLKAGGALKAHKTPKGSK